MITEVVTRGTCGKNVPTSLEKSCFCSLLATCLNFFKTSNLKIEIKISALVLLTYIQVYINVDIMIYYQ